MFQKNKPFFIFLLKFGGTYLVLTLLYSFYLSRFDEAHFQSDSITRMVAKQSSWFANLIGETASVEPHPSEPSFKFIINGEYLRRVVEGCNGVSVMILFAAFIMAFSSTVKRTGIYIIIGVVVIHLLNVVRIALINVAFYYYRGSGPLLHDIIFPLFIYGVVFMLWVAWVVKFRGHAKK